MKKHKLVRVTTVPLSLDKLLDKQLGFMQTYFNVIAVSSSGNGYLKKIGEKEGIRVHYVEMTRQITLFKDLRALLKMYRFLKQEKPLIVHTHTPKAGIVGMLAARLAGVPVRLHTVAGLPLMEATGLKRKVLDVVEKLTYACATQVYPNSAGLRDFILLNGYGKPEKIKVIANGSSNGIDTTHFSPAHYSIRDLLDLREKYGISPSDFVFVFIGRLVTDKGINELVAAFRQISKSTNQHIKLLLVGNSEEELDPLLPQTLKLIESSPVIITTGYQDDVRPFVAMADALVFPSYREGFPNVVLQAGAMGLPAIVTDINGCNEIIIEGENGAIVPPKDAKALQEAMERMITDAEWREQLAANARPMIAMRYEQQVVWEALLAEYRRLLAEKGLG